MTAWTLDPDGCGPVPPSARHGTVWSLGRPPWSILPCGPFLTVACTREDCDWSRGRLLSRLAADRHGLDHYQRAHGGRR